MPAKSKKLTGVLAGFLLASFAAIIGTLMHQTQIQNNLPLGVFFSLSLVFMLAALVRDRFSSKAAGLVFTVSLGVEVFIIGQNLTGDILIPGNNLGLWWSYGAIGVAALVALWPKLKN